MAEAGSSKIFQGRAQLSKNSSSSINVPNWDMACIVQGKIADWLRTVGEDEAAAWFEKYWCGLRGNWTIADAGVSGVPNGCGPESKWEKLTRAVCGNSGKTKSLKVDIFVSGLVKFIADISKETAIQQIKEFKTHRFLNAPVPTSAM